MIPRHPISIGANKIDPKILKYHTHKTASQHRPLSKHGSCPRPHSLTASLSLFLCVCGGIGSEITPRGRSFRFPLSDAGRFSSSCKHISINKTMQADKARVDHSFNHLKEQYPTWHYYPQLKTIQSHNLQFFEAACAGLKDMGAFKLELRCPQKVHGIVVDPECNWSFESLSSELHSLEKKLHDRVQFLCLSPKLNLGRV
ncbi:protein GLE [Salix suchowensis]|nr:protein GLE [Salix suchowensis]